MDLYYCIYCNRALEVVNDVVVHDDVPHPINETFDEEENEH